MGSGHTMVQVLCRVLGLAGLPDSHSVCAGDGPVLRALRALRRALRALLALLACSLTGGCGVELCCELLLFGCELLWLCTEQH